MRTPAFLDCWGRPYIPARAAMPACSQRRAAAAAAAAAAVALTAAAQGAEEQQADSALQTFLGWLLANGGC